MSLPKIVSQEEWAAAFARGLAGTGGSYYFLDLTALGRQEDWEEPKGRTEETRTNSPDFAT